MLRRRRQSERASERARAHARIIPRVSASSCVGSHAHAHAVRSVCMQTCMLTCLLNMLNAFPFKGTLVPAQRINHFPDMRQIYNKAFLAKNVNALQEAMDGEITPFAPQSWSIPEELSKLTAHLGPNARRGSLVTNTGNVGGGTAAAAAPTASAFTAAAPTAAAASAASAAARSEMKQSNGSPSKSAGPTAAAAASGPRGAVSFKHAAGAGAEDQAVYIVKPASGLQGHGIGLFTNPMEAAAVQEGKKAVVQQYLGRPMLIDGFKFDLRLYVLVSSVEPLKVHLFNDGLARLCTKKYTVPDASNLKRRQAHLTNYAVNKSSKDFVKGSQGSKRSVKAVFQLLRDRGIDTDRVWSDIVDCVNHTMLAVHPKLQQAYKNLIPPKSTLRTPTSSCFEILGFDVMLDSTGGVWLIEVNHAPSFKGGSKVDNRVKHGAVSGALELLKLSTKRKRILSMRVRKKWEKYMHAQALNPLPRSGGSADSTGSGAGAATGAGTGAGSSRSGSGGRAARPLTARQRAQAEVGGWRNSATATAAAPPLSAQSKSTASSVAILPTSLRKASGGSKVGGMDSAGSISVSSKRPSASRTSASRQGKSSSSISASSKSRPSRPSSAASTSTSTSTTTTASKLASAGNVEDMMVQLALGLDGEDDEGASLGIYNDDGGDDIEQDSDDCADLGSDSDDGDMAAIEYRNTLSPTIPILPASALSTPSAAAAAAVAAKSGGGSKQCKTRMPRPAGGCKPAPARFKAPLLTDEDAYIQIYSSNSVSDRATYARVIEAANLLCAPGSTDA